MPDSDGNVTFADEYQDLTKDTEIYTAAAEDFLQPAVDALGGVNSELMEMRDWLSLAYCTGKLNGESGELAELVFKAFRGGRFGTLDSDQKELALKELGDILWYVARISDLLGFRLSDVMTTNIKKLFDRKDRGVLHGYGDVR